MASTSSPIYNPGALGLYNQQLGLAQSNYNNILQGYGQAQSNIGNSLQGIYQGYNTDQQQIMNTLGVSGGGWGVAAPAAKQIEQSFVNTQGQNQQSLINSGLGNSSLLAQSNNQANLMAGQAYASLGSQLASTAAGYQAQFGLARQAAQMQGLGLQTNLSSSYLGDLAGYKFQPNVPLYGTYSNNPTNANGGGGGSRGSGSGSGSSPFSGLAGYNGNAPNNLGYSGAYANGSSNPYGTGTNSPFPTQSSSTSGDENEEPNGGYGGYLD